MPRQKQESIRFRCSQDTYEFIERLRSVGRDEVNKRNRSEVVRNIIQVFRLAWLTGEMDMDGLVKKLKMRFESADESLIDGEEMDDEGDDEQEESCDE